MMKINNSVQNNDIFEGKYDASYSLVGGTRWDDLYASRSNPDVSHLLSDWSFLYLT